MNTVVDGTFDKYNQIVDFLEARGEISFASDMRDLQAKVLLLSAASFFEAEVRSCIERFCSSVSNNHAILIEFVRNRALERQYHVLFDWEAKNANKFWSLFGADFKRYAEQRVKADVALADGVAAFLRIGAERNRLVHLNYAAFVLDSTAAEIYDLYKRAYVFAQNLETVLMEFTPGPGEDVTG